jgi:hypothetical protein
VPTGLQRLLCLAAVDVEFRQKLVELRSAVASAAEVPLTASERSILDTVPASHLEAMIGGLPPPPGDRREFLRSAAASAVVLLGGAALSASCQEPKARGPFPVDSPDRERHRMPAPGGANPDVAWRRRGPDAGASPARPEPPVPPPPVPAGIRPDLPLPRPAGIRPDLPPPRKPGDK